MIPCEPSLSVDSRGDYERGSQTNPIHVASIRHHTLSISAKSSSSNSNVPELLPAELLVLLLLLLVSPLLLSVPLPLPKLGSY